MEDQDGPKSTLVILHKKISERFGTKINNPGSKSKSGANIKPAGITMGSCTAAQDVDFGCDCIHGPARPCCKLYFGSFWNSTGTRTYLKYDVFQDGVLKCIR